MKNLVIMNLLGAPGSHLGEFLGEPPGRFLERLGATWELLPSLRASESSGRRVGAPGGPAELPGAHGSHLGEPPGRLLERLGATWELLRSHLEASAPGGVRELPGGPAEVWC